MRARFRYPGAPVRVRFLRRPNRFLARVAPSDGGPRTWAHVPNPGRMEELLVPGTTAAVMVPAGGRTERRTRWELVAVRHGRSLVSIDAGVANRLAALTLGSPALPGYGAGPWRPEPRYGGHRFDFGVAAASGWAELLEIKSSNLRVGRTALFPDAPTARGARQLVGLARAARSGVRAHLLFAIQRSDVEEFRPNDRLDPTFADALARATDAGVTVSARCLEVRPGSVAWGRAIPVRSPWAPGGTGGELLRRRRARPSTRYGSPTNFPAAS